jgi:hypothetical protein
MLNRAQVLAAGKACIQRVHNLARRQSRVEGLPDRVNVRVFFAASMIVYFRENVFEAVGPLETRLIAAARDLLDSFERILRSAIALREWRLVPADLVRPLPAALATYLRLFAEWKIPDSQKLAQRIQAALLALYAARADTPDDDPHALPDFLVCSLHTQIARLRAKLGLVGGGDAMALFDALHPPPQAPIDPLLAPRTAGWERPSSEALAHALFLDPHHTPSLDDIRPPAPIPVTFWETLAPATDRVPPCFARHMYALRNTLDAISALRRRLVDDGLVDDGLVDDGLVDDGLDKQLSEAFATLPVEDPRPLRMLDAVLGKLLPVMTPERADFARTQWLLCPHHDPANATGPRWHVGYATAVYFLHENAASALYDDCLRKARAVAAHMASHTDPLAFERALFQRRAADLPNTSAWLLAHPRHGLLSPAETHAEALLRFVLHPETLTPETLLMDLPRIALIGKDMRGILDILVAVNTADHALDMASFPQQNRTRFLDRLAQLLAEDQLADSARPNHTIRQLAAQLLAEVSVRLDPAGQAILLYQLADSARPNHTIRLAVAHLLPAALLRAPQEPPLIVVPPPVGPLIQAALARFEVLRAANLRLHGAAYAALQIRQ